MPNGSLDTAVDALIEDFSRKILNKLVPDLKDDVAVNSGVEISCIILNELRKSKWLDNWMVFAGIQKLDKGFGRTRMRRVHRPWLDGGRPSNPCRSTGRIPSCFFAH
jgi:hypothetical protein